MDSYLATLDKTYEQNKSLIRYLKVTMTGHEGNELYCTLNHVQVYGKSMHSSLKGALKDVNTKSQAANAPDQRVTQPTEDPTLPASTECLLIENFYKDYIYPQTKAISVAPPPKFQQEASTEVSLLQLPNGASNSTIETNISKINFNRKDLKQLYVS